MELNLSQILFGIIVVMFVTAGLSMFSTDVLLVHYPTGNITNFSLISKMNATYNQTQEMYEQVQGSTSEHITSTDYAITGGWNTMLLMFGFTDIISSSITDISNESPFPIPTWFTQMLLVLFGVALMLIALMYIRGVPNI